MMRTLLSVRTWSPLSGRTVTCPEIQSPAIFHYRSGQDDPILPYSHMMYAASSSMSRINDFIIDISFVSQESNLIFLVFVSFPIILLFLKTNIFVSHDIISFSISL